MMFCRNISTKNWQLMPQQYFEKSIINIMFEFFYAPIYIGISKQIIITSTFFRLFETTTSLFLNRANSVSADNYFFQHVQSRIFFSVNHFLISKIDIFPNCLHSKITYPFICVKIHYSM